VQVADLNEDLYLVSCSCLVFY